MELTASLMASGTEGFSASTKVVLPLPDGRGSVGGFSRLVGRGFVFAVGACCYLGIDNRRRPLRIFFCGGYQEVSDGEGWTLFLQPEVLLEKLNNVTEAPVCEGRFSAVNLDGDFGTDAEWGKSLSVIGDGDQFEDGPFFGVGG
jgi:hypothetical protein